MNTTVWVASVLAVGCAGTLLMALARQVVPVLLQGLDELAPRQVGVTGRLDVLINMFAQQGQPGGYEFVPRPGVTALPRTADTGSITTGMKLATLGTSLLLLTGTSCYRRAIDQWHLVADQVPPVGVSSAKIAGSPSISTACDVAYVNGYTVGGVSGSPSTGSMTVSAKDANGALVAEHIVEVGGSIGNVKIAVSGTFAVVFWQFNTAIHAWRFDSNNPTATAVPTVVTTTANNAAPFDVQTAPSTGNIGVAWVDTVSGNLTQTVLTPSSMLVGAPLGYAGLGAGITPLGYLANNFSTAEYFIAHVGPAGLRYSSFNVTTLALNATVVRDAGTTAAINITGVRAGATVNLFITTVGGPGFAPVDYQIKGSSSPGAPARIMGGMAIASRAMSANGTFYVLGRYSGTGQGTYYLIDLAGSIQGTTIGRALSDTANVAATPVTSLANLMPTSSANVWLTAGLNNTALDSSIFGLSAYTDGRAITFTYQDPTIGKAVELNQTLHIPGAQPYLYDGETLTELGFPIAAEPADAPTLAGGGGLTASSTYTYRWLYEWSDAAGNVHRSAPSSPQQVVLGVGQTKATFTVPTLRSTRKFGVTIVAERTIANGDGSAFYKLNQFGSPLMNDPTVDRVTFVDTIADTALVAGEPLYTNGGILENIAPPPCKAMAVHRGRILVGGVDGDPTAVWFSKDVEPGFGVAFNDGLVSRLNSGSEAVTAVGSLDSVAVACTATTTWGSSDDYPDDTGNPGVLRFSQTSATNGCAAASLMARGENGLAVWNAKKTTPGPWQIDRGLSWTWLGSPVQVEASVLTPRAIISVPGQNQIRVVGNTSARQALVYEGIFKTWSFWDYSTILLTTTWVDAVVWNGAVTYLGADGRVYVEDTTTLNDTDGASGTPLYFLSLSNFNFAGVAGYQRIYVGQLTGRIVGTTSNALQLFATQTADDIAMPSKSLASLPNAANNYSAEVDPGPNGKCSSYQIAMFSLSGNNNVGWTLAAMTMSVGIKPNVNRLPPARRMT